MSLPVAKVQLRVSCTKLLDLDLLSKSDPQVFLFCKASNGQWVQNGKTEVIWDNLNPKFATPFEIDFFFEEIQNLRFVVVDVDKGKGERGVADQEFIGQLEIKLSEVFTARGQILERNLVDQNNGDSKFRGKIKISAEEKKGNTQEIIFKFSATHLDKKDFFGKSDPYYVISSLKNNGDWVVCAKGDVKYNTLNPSWESVTYRLRDLNNGEMERLLLIQVFDWNKIKEHELIGEFQASLSEIMSKKPNKFSLINPAKTKKKSYVNSGTFVIENFDLSAHRPTFLDYVAAGLDINLAVAIDFTASNGDPKKSSSLHYIGLNQNPYQQAIFNVGTILENYDSDKQIPLFGFGARIPRGEVSHCFPLNGQPGNPEVNGVAGMMEAYHHSISRFELYGPTNFSPVLRATESVIKASLRPGTVKYFILLIITDGEITDMDDTIRAIVDVSHLPLSIVIVGVGNADFSKMKVLDGDEVPLEYNGKKRVRDIVQFVPFNEFPDYLSLARETLAEIPQQLTDYMWANRISPGQAQLN